MIARKRVFVDLLARHRKALDAVYASHASLDAKRAAKLEEFAALHADYEAIRGERYRPPTNPPLYVGRVAPSVLPHVARSAERAAERGTHAANHDANHAE